MDFNDLTSNLLQRLLTVKSPCSFVCDGAIITQTSRKQSSTGGPSSFYEYQFSFDEYGRLHMQARVWPDVPTMDEQKEIVGGLEAALKLFCDGCPDKGTERCEAEIVHMFRFDDGKVSYAAEPVQLGPEPDMEDVFAQCCDFETDFSDAVNEMFMTIEMFNTPAVIIIDLDDLPPDGNPTPDSDKAK